MGPSLSYLFIDESGVAGLSSPQDTYGQYLCLLGCAVTSEDYWRIIVPALTDLKLRHFPGCDPARTVLHRADIVARRGVFGILKAPERQAAFDAAILQLYSNLPYTLISVVVDKVAHARHPRRFYENPYHWALAMMLERYCGLLRVSSRIGRVVCEARGPNPDRMLQRAYEQVLDKGTPHPRHPAPFFSNVLARRQVRFMPKIPSVAGLELADGLVRTAKLEILTENGKSEPVDHPFQAAIEGVIGSKWNRRWATGQVQGYGKAFFTIPY